VGVLLKHIWYDLITLIHICLTFNDVNELETRKEASWIDTLKQVDDSGRISYFYFICSLISKFVQLGQ
jgi:hypothetical protein